MPNKTNESKKNKESVKTTLASTAPVVKTAEKKVELLDVAEARICATCKKEFSTIAKWQNKCDDCK